MLLKSVLGDLAAIERDNSDVLHLNWTNQPVSYTLVRTFTL